MSNVQKSSAALYFLFKHLHTTWRSKPQRFPSVYISNANMRVNDVTELARNRIEQQHRILEPLAVKKTTFKQICVSTKLTLNSTREVERNGVFFFSSQEAKGDLKSRSKERNSFFVCGLWGPSHLLRLIY